MGNRKISYSINSIFTILISYSSCLSFSQKPPTNIPVLDVDGNPLQTDAKYKGLSPSGGGGGGGGAGAGGGLALSIRDRRYPCPANVMQENDQASVGLSLKIFQVDTKPNITQHTDVNIVFMAATICVQPTVWQLGNADPFTARRYVRSAGVVGRPGAETLANWFKIERAGEGYKIVYCPSVCNRCRFDCGDVGVFVENGRRWLGLGGEPLVIVFQKVV